MNRIAVLAALTGSLFFVFASPLLAASTDRAAPSPTGQDASQMQGAQPQGTKGASGKERYQSPQERGRQTEARVKELHDQLGVTGEQEGKWAEVAKTMRDNEAEISGLIETRHKNAASMNALEDLQSYQDITQAHADGIKKMIAAFEPLYDDMSESQKKNADQVFNSFRGRHKANTSKSQK